MVPATVELVYVHDPMCSWCWAFGPALRGLRAALPPQVAFRRLLGGLAPDSAAPMPEEMRRDLQQTWRRIAQQVPGTEFNHAFWEQCRPRRSTWPACRAVLAARRQGPEREPGMIGAIQQAYYRQARNPSDKAVLVELAWETGLDVARFLADLDDPHLQAELLREIDAARRLGATSFPSLVLRRDTAAWPVPVDYRDADAMLETVHTLLT